RTEDLLARLLQGQGRVLDVGGGPGVYAAWLSDRGYQVDLVDPVVLHVEEARKRAGDPPSFAVTPADARALPFDDEEFDAVLVFGPIYHLAERSERVKALREAGRVCRGGGLVLASAISRFSAALDGIREGWITEEERFARVQIPLTTGRHAPNELP